MMLDVDIRNVLDNMDREQLWQLCHELIRAWGHPKTCACLKCSEPMGDGTIIVGPGEEPCDCGADARLAKCVETTLAMTHGELGLLPGGKM